MPYSFSRRHSFESQRSCRVATSRTLALAVTVPVAAFANPAPNPAVDPVRFALWTLRDKAAQRRSPLR